MLISSADTSDLGPLSLQQTQTDWHVQSAQSQHHAHTKGRNREGLQSAHAHTGNTSKSKHNLTSLRNELKPFVSLSINTHTVHTNKANPPLMRENNIKCVLSKSVSCPAVNNY